MPNYYRADSTTLTADSTQITADYMVFSDKKYSFELGNCRGGLNENILPPIEVTGILASTTKITADTTKYTADGYTE
tara:strand:- start:593 stop:823 length:231 start_codon:yes stop_codon:yes gene_type:complete